MDLISDTVTLPEAPSVVTLSFMEWYDTYSNEGYISLDISTDLGSTWNSLIENRTGANTSWANQSISLDPYRGNTVKLRFRLETDYSSTDDGWYVDDFAITSIDSTKQPEISISPSDGMSIHGSDTVYRDIEITNTGNAELRYRLNPVTAESSSFVSGDNDTGRVAPTETESVTLGFDFTDFFSAEEKTGVIEIYHDALMQSSPVAIPCTLSLTPTTMDISETTLSSTIAAGDSDTLSFDVSNTGGASLFLTPDMAYGIPASGEGKVIINEVCVDFDFIEILNTGGSTVDISGWELEWDDNEDSDVYYHTFSSGASIPPMETYTLYDEGESISFDDNYDNASGNLDWTDESDIGIKLLNQTGDEVDAYYYTSSREKPISF